MSVSSLYNQFMKIFISYAEQDRPYATALGKALKDASQDIWEPQDLQPGENWRLKSGEALAEADAVVVLLSPESVATEWVRREIEFAISSPRLKGRLIPVLVRPSRDIPWILRELPQWLEADDPSAAAKGIVSILLVKQKKKARIGRNPATGEEIKIPAKTVQRFRISKGAKDPLLSAKK